MDKKFKKITFVTDILERFSENTPTKNLWEDIAILDEAKDEIKNNHELVVEYLERLISEKTAEAVEEGFCPECGADLESEEIYPETRMDVGVYRAVCPNCNWKED